MVFVVSGSPSLSCDEFLQPEATAMSDNKSGPLAVELITRCIDEQAQKVGMMDPDNPKCATVLAELFPINATQAISKIRKHAGG